MHHISAKFVLRLLTDDQKENHVEISQELLAIANSLDLAPADFFLFPKLKITLKGHRFQTLEEIQENVTNPTNSLCTCSLQRM
jgi:hypothetical protein